MEKETSICFVDKKVVEFSKKKQMENLKNPAETEVLPSPERKFWLARSLCS